MKNFKLHDLVMILNQDVKNENESSKPAIAIRIINLMFIVYFIFWALLFAFKGTFLLSLISLVFIAAYAYSFWCTYKNSTMFFMMLKGLFTIIWIIIFLVFFGWDYGVQHFCFVIVMQYFLFSYDKLSVKSIFVTAICIFRLALYIFCKVHVPIVMVSTTIGFLFQIINSVMAFASIAVVSYIFGSGAQNMENKLIQYNERLKNLSSIDELTKLWNRRKMMDYLHNVACAYNKGESEMFSIAIADIDFFKRVNDDYGHDCGDKVLQEISCIMAEYMKKQGKVCRYGGEEFLFVIKDVNGDIAYSILHTLLDKIRRHEIVYNNMKIKITMTIGLEEFGGIRNLEETIKKADEKLYIGKKSGRNQIVY